MKKIFGVVLLFATMVLFVSCSKDDGDDITLTKEQIVGTWDVVWAEQDGESTDIPKGYIYMKINEDGSYKTTMFNDYYIGTYKIEGNTIIGTTIDPITERYKFTNLDGNNASINYCYSQVRSATSPPPSSALGA